MSDVTSSTLSMLAIISSAKKPIVASRKIVRAGGANESLEPGCLLQADANATRLEPWGGVNAVLGVLLEPITATTSEQIADVLCTGAVKNENVYIYNATLGKVTPSAAQWAIVAASGIVPVGVLYQAVGAIDGNLVDEDDMPLNAVVVTLKDADGNTIATDTTDVSGGFDFSGIAVGTYTLNTAATDTYYALADSVTVTENATTVAAMEALFKVGSIAGVCSDNDEPAQLLENVSLICYLSGHSGIPEYGPVLSNADGEYEFPAVRVGTAWIVTASLAGHDDETADPVTVATDTETELNLTLDVTT